MNEINLDYHITLADGGSRYAETNLKEFIVEPWNAISSLFLVLPALFWAIKIRRKISENYFIFLCIPLLFLGGIGSTLFHAFRASPILLFMDVFPMMILTLSVGAYLWHKLLKKWPYTFIVILFSFLLRFFIMSSNYFDKHTSSNFSYVVSGLTIFIPATVIIFKTNFRKLNYLLLSIFFFVFSLIFRKVDLIQFNLLPMGTHFLWHVFSAVGSFFLAEYLYGLDNFFSTNFAEKESINIESDFDALSRD